MNNIMALIREREIATLKNENTILIIITTLIFFLGLIVTLFIKLNNLRNQMEWDFEYLDGEQLFEDEE